MNRNTGILLGGYSSALFEGDTNGPALIGSNGVFGNGFGGIAAGSGSIGLSDTTIELNARFGVHLTGNSTLGLAGNVLIQGNGIGVRMQDASIINTGAGGEPAGTQIKNNLEQGVLCAPSPPSVAHVAKTGPNFGTDILTSNNVFGNGASPQVDCPELVVP